MSIGEPPSRASGLLLIGRNSCGNWVVQDPAGLHGGLFVDRVHALKYAMSTNGGRPRAVVMVPDVLELYLSARPRGIEPKSEDQPALRKLVARGGLSGPGSQRILQLRSSDRRVRS